MLPSFNRDMDETLSPENATSGGSVGGVEAHEMAWEANARAHSASSIPYFLSEEQDNLNKYLKENGEEPLPKIPFLDTDAGYSLGQYAVAGPYAPALLAKEKLSEQGAYTTAARYLSAGSKYKEDDEEFMEGSRIVGEYDKAVALLRERRPDLKLSTSAEQFEAVRKKAKEAEENWRYVQTSFGGAIGGFAGDVTAQFNATLNPLNVATLPLGGVGKTAVARIGAEAGINAGAEALNQLTGTMEQRELLGLETSFGQVAIDAAAAGVGAGVLQGAGELVGKAVGRYFPNTKADPAPPRPDAPLRAGEEPPVGTPPEQAARMVSDRDAEQLVRAHGTTAEDVTLVDVYGDTPYARAVAEDDVASVKEVLDRWDTTVDDIEPLVTPERGTSLIDDAARAVDPEAFRLYDLARRDIERAAADIEAARALDVVAPESPARLSEGAAIDEAQGTVHFLDTASKEKDLWARVRGEQAANNVADVIERGTARMSSAEQALKEVQPLIERAYARAEGALVASADIKKRVGKMVSQRGALVDAAPVRSVSRAAPVQLSTEASETLARGSKGLEETTTQALSRINRVEADQAEQIAGKVIDDALDAMEKGELADVLPNGVSLDTPVERITLPNGEESIRTLRDVLDDIRDADIDMKAVTECPITTS